MKTFTSLFLLLIGFALQLSAVNISVKKLDSGFIQVKPENFYLGNDDSVVGFTFYFDNLSAQCNMIVSTNKSMNYSKPIGVVFHMADGTDLYFGHVESNDFIIFKLDFLYCVSTDFKGNYDEASFPERNCCGLNKLSQVNIKQIEINYLLIDVTQPTAQVFKEVITKGISMVPDKSDYALFGKNQSSTAKTNPSSKTGKASTNKSKKGSGNKSSNNSSVNKKTTKPATDERLRQYMLHPLGSLNSDTYFSYLKACENLKKTYGKECSHEYDGCGKIYIHNLDDVNVGDYHVNNVSLWIYSDKTEWSYRFPDMPTLSGAKDVCNALATKIKALGVELTDKPSDSFPVYYKGMMGDKAVRLSACKMSDKYYLTLEITDFKTADKPDINPEVSVADFFHRPLGAPKGADPIRWFLEKGYAGKVNEKQNEVRCYSGSSKNNLSLHIPIQGSKIYQGLKSYNYTLKKADRSSYNTDKDIYTVEFIGDLRPSIKSWNVKSKQEKEELKYLWNNFILERLRLGYKPVKTNKKAPEFKQWNPAECYIEHDGAIIRRYILTKNNKVIITEEKPSVSK